MEKILIVRDAVAAFGKKTVLRGLSLEIDEGKITAVIGPNGAGKSTLLRLIAGMLTPKEGEVFFRDENITNWTMTERAVNGIGYVMQGGSVFSSLDVTENLEIAAYNLPEDEISDRIEETFNFFPILTALRRRRAGLLSGGERQLLSIAIQIIRRPQILLLDEPSVGLSPQMVDTVFGLLKEINHKFGTSIIIVEQNIGTVLRNSHLAFALNDGQVAIQSAEPSKWLGTRQLEQVFLGGDLIPFAGASSV